MNSPYLIDSTDILRRAGLGLCLVLALACPRLAAADDVMPSPQPDQRFAADHAQHLVLEVKFAADGRVASCKTIKSSGSVGLDHYTVDFIRKNWNCPSLAGHTGHLPIDYQAAQKVAAQPVKSAPEAVAKPYQAATVSGISGGNSSSGGSGGFAPGTQH